MAAGHLGGWAGATIRLSQFSEMDEVTHIFGDVRRTDDTCKGEGRKGWRGDGRPREDGEERGKSVGEEEGKEGIMGC